MALTEQAVNLRVAPATLSSTLVAFTLTTFLSALLLFSIQPMFAKMVLPLLGGSPSVWAVALCFFQGALLAGYGYAHLLIAKSPIRTTGFVHLGLCLVAFLFLPMALPTGWTEPPSDSPYLWQLGLFAVAIGVPFMAVAANAPLLQAWFAGSGHTEGADPYFLYAASNLGSLVALLGYPFLLEPVFGLTALSTLWTTGFAILVLALAGCFWLVRQPETRAASTPSPADTTDGVHCGARPTWGKRASWTGLALVPSALLTALTTHIATDIASAPLIWVIPLALYLATFVIAFRERLLIPWPALLPLQLATVAFALVLVGLGTHGYWTLTAATGILAFFFSALVAHRTLYEARPPARDLTEFYLWMSLGGVLGGLFAALLAPQLFSEVLEYPLLLALTIACRPGVVFTDGAASPRTRGNELAISLLIAAGGSLILYCLGKVALEYAGFERLTLGARLALAAAVLMVLLSRSPMRQAGAAVIMFTMVALFPPKESTAQRSFFGVYRVDQSENGQFNLLSHGTTLHGAQRIRNERGEAVVDTTPGTYYHPASPMAEAVKVARASLAAKGEKGRFGIVGLGAGSLACYAEAGEPWRFFEIDPLMVTIAQSNFTFLSNCQPKADIVIGDARLTLSKETADSFDLLIVDAFSSDAVPVHLMTREALQLYLSKLRPGGVAVLHISNRHLDLDSVLAATVPQVPGLHGLIVSDEHNATVQYAQTLSKIAVFARDDAALAPFRAMRGAHAFEPGKVRPWTDDASDILGPFLSKLH